MFNGGAMNASLPGYFGGESEYEYTEVDHSIYNHKQTLIISIISPKRSSGAPVGGPGATVGAPVGGGASVVLPNP